MGTKMVITVVVALAILVSAAILYFGLIQTRPAEIPDAAESPTPVASPSIEVSRLTSPSPPVATTSTISAADIPGVNNDFTFTAKIPLDWRAEAVPGSDAVNLYDPAAAGVTSLEKSQIFIRSFTANQFLTLSTVTIQAQEDLTINGRPAVRYEIQKKPGIAPFSDQPSWRSQRHVVTDIRVSNTNPSVFYVIAQRPGLPDETYQTFLQRLQVETLQNTQEVVLPIAGFEKRITKKPFGVHITPQNSPIQPERFSGWHTGADVEYEDMADDVPIHAIASGTVLTSRSASGYGGVAAVRHVIDGEQIVAVYGHLDPATLPTAGSSVASGQIIGVLGETKSAETDGERKHLHFAILPGSTVDLRGYVQQESELGKWRDPVDFLHQAGAS